MHGLACMQRSIGIQLTNPAAVLSRRLSFFSLFPVVLGIGLTWLYAWIFTIAGVYDSASPETQVRGLSAAPWFAPLLLLASVKHTPALPSCCCRCGCLVQKACTTSQSNFNYILSEAPWFRVPYPGQYGSPIFTTTGDHVTVGWAEGWAQHDLHSCNPSRVRRPWCCPLPNAHPAAQSWPWFRLHRRANDAGGSHPRCPGVHWRLLCGCATERRSPAAGGGGVPRPGRGGRLLRHCRRVWNHQRLNCVRRCERTHVAAVAIKRQRWCIGARGHSLGTTWRM